MGGQRPQMKGDLPGRSAKGPAGGGGSPTGKEIFNSACAAAPIAGNWGALIRMPLPEVIGPDRCGAHSMRPHCIPVRSGIAYVRMRAPREVGPAITGGLRGKAGPVIEADRWTGKNAELVLPTSGAYLVRAADGTEGQPCLAEVVLPWSHSVDRTVLSRRVDAARSRQQAAGSGSHRRDGALPAACCVLPVFSPFVKRSRRAGLRHVQGHGGERAGAERRVRR